MYDRVLVITINSYYSKVPSTGTAVLLRSTVPTSVYIFVALCQLIKTALLLRELRTASTLLISKSSIVHRDVHYISACFYNITKKRNSLRPIYLESYSVLLFEEGFRVE